MKFIDTKVDSSMRYLMFLVAGLFIVIAVMITLYSNFDTIQSFTWYDTPLTHDQKMQISLVSGTVIAVAVLIVFRGKLHG